MRQNSSLAGQPNVGRRQAARVSFATSNHTHQAWYKRATEHAILVRRAICGAKDETISAIGLAAAVRAIKGGSVGDLLVTRRFAENFPVAAANTSLLAAIFGVRTTTVTGPAEFELDLVAGGVAVLCAQPA